MPFHSNSLEDRDDAGALTSLRYPNQQLSVLPANLALPASTHRTGGAVPLNCQPALQINLRAMDIYLHPGSWVQRISTGVRLIAPARGINADTFAEINVRRMRSGRRTTTSTCRTAASRLKASSANDPDLSNRPLTVQSGDWAGRTAQISP